MKALLLVSGLVLCTMGIAVLPAAASTKPAVAAHTVRPPLNNAHRHRAGGMPESARTFYALNWGVDQLSAQLAESGQLVRFSYRVVDATKAGALHDKASAPNLIDEKARVALLVPTMEKVGPLRQASPPENGKSYWMVFSNKGNVVRTGHRVSVVIGSFRVDGLVVQ